MKKKGKIRVCVDFRDLNVVTPKDMHVMPIANMLVESAGNYELLSFKDGFSSYNKILIAIEDISKISLRCPGSIGKFEWLVMPFGLKNVGATYQREINAIFHDMLSQRMEVYIDNIMVKSKRANEHVDHLRKSLERMRHHQFKLNSLKCAFRVHGGNFLGFLVHKKGIEVDHNKAKAITSAKAPQNKEELQKFLGKVNNLRRFISNLVGTTKEFLDLVKLKDVEEFRWEERYQEPFNKFKDYLSKPLVLMPPIQGD